MKRRNMGPMILGPCCASLATWTTLSFFESEVKPLHTDQARIDTKLVRRLVATQFPEWSHLPIRFFDSSGTSHAIYRLGDERCLRLPLAEATQLQMQKESQWLAMLAPDLPLSIPVPIAAGQASESYPYEYPWLAGEEATLETLADEETGAVELARFVAALESIDPSGGPEAGAHNFYRGVPLRHRDEEVRQALVQLEQLETKLETSLVARIWEDSLAADATFTPVWIHGDLHSGNLLAVDGQLRAVIDFGGLGVGDPACDLLVAWWLFSKAGRRSFRRELNVDNACWRRGRGWALSMAVMALPYYMQKNPRFAAVAERALREVIAEFTGGQ